LETDRWYYLAYTYTLADNNVTVAIYVDGELTHSQQIPFPGGFPVSPTRITIGTWGNQGWTGIVDEVRLWNRALTAEEIKQSMNQSGEQLLTVEPREKLTSSWGRIKAGF